MENSTQRRLFDAVIWSASLAFLAALVVHEASASEKTFTSSNARWQSECSSCHMPKVKDKKTG